MILNRRAVAWGTGVAVGLYTIHVLLLPVLVETGPGGSSNSILFGIHQMLGVATWLAGGYVAARMAGEKGFVYGFVVGVLGTILTALASIVWSLLTSAEFPIVVTLPFWILVNGFLAAFAGLLTTGTVSDPGGRRGEGGMDG